MNKKIENTKTLSIKAGDNKHQSVAFLERLEKDRNTKKLNYYIWLSRLTIFLACSSLILFMSASLSLFKLAPQIFVEPFMLINQDNSDDIVRSEAIISNMYSRDKVLEIYMRQYIILRNTIIPDELEMQSRWFPGGAMNFLSANNIFLEFQESIQGEAAKAIEANASRSVVIDSIKRIGGKRSPIWKATFRTFELSPNNVDNNQGVMKLTTKYWTASIRAGFFPQRIFMARRLINPLGFTVLDYSQAQVNVF